MQVAPGIHRLTAGVVNFYLLEEGGRLLVIDAGTPKDWNVLLQGIQATGRTLADVEAILLTHAHSDHTGFAERGRRESGTRILVHEADAAVARGAKQPKNDGSITAYLLKPAFYRTTASLLRRGGGRIVPIQEVATFGDGAVLDLPGSPKVVLAPGHTPGSAVLVVESHRAAFTGDALVTWNALTGRSGPQVMPAGLNRDTPEALRSLDLLSELPVEVLLPGHGDPWNGGAEEAVRLAQMAGRS
jgi:glyoxylase-like metal-dependent hydrolase (beta-lactamase superfamily II)